MDLTSEQKQSIAAQKGSFKIINKPWGHEEWWTPVVDHRKYMLKKLRINKGHRTSIHVHRGKVETTYILSGTIRVWTGWRDEVIGTVDGKETLTGELFPREYTEGECFDIYPGQVHRVEALTDVDFIEVATALPLDSKENPDDVERFGDDWDRGHGRIPGEHQDE